MASKQDANSRFMMRDMLGLKGSVAACNDTPMPSNVKQPDRTSSMKSDKVRKIRNLHPSWESRDDCENASLLASR
jgi:hypothetical protein